MIIEGPPGPTNINIYIFHNLIHIYDHSCTCIYPVMKCFCITKNYGVKFILNIPGAVKHNIKNVEVFR